MGLETAPAQKATRTRCYALLRRISAILGGEKLHRAVVVCCLEKSDRIYITDSEGFHIVFGSRLN